MSELVGFLNGTCILVLDPELPLRLAGNHHRYPPSALPVYVSERDTSLMMSFRVSCSHVLCENLQTRAARDVSLFRGNSTCVKFLPT